ncbi:potassium channel family protein [Geminicoccus roseus]|uniref:potassium channel family protein n=1 Tax=Geminicoccus roseus TaxID=404900 RepID=UPI0003FE63D0|nr:potassium channel family protein [Geminicoccus roseus]
MSWLAPLAGLALLAAALADIFLTVLQSRGAGGFISRNLNAGLWRLACRCARTLPGGQARAFLSYVGPGLLVATVLGWMVLLTAGFALICWPALGTNIQASQGPTPTDFWAALYFSGFNLTTLGVGDFTPKTSFYRLLTVVEAGIGFSVLTLTLTYVMSLYSALLQRDSTALLIHQMSGRTGNPAMLLAHLGPGGAFGSARSEVLSVTTQLLSILEAHHAYPALHYFRRREPLFAMARVGLLALDTASLARTALDHERHAAFLRSAPLEALWGSGLRLLEGSRQIVPRRRPEQEGPDGLACSGDDEQRWRQRFEQALRQFQAAGLATTADPASGADRYVALRRQWDADLRSMAAYMALPWPEIAPHKADVTAAQG